MDQDIAHRKPDTMYFSMTSDVSFYAQYTSGSNMPLRDYFQRHIALDILPALESTVRPRLRLQLIVSFFRQEKPIVPGGISPTSAPTLKRQLALYHDSLHVIQTRNATPHADLWQAKKLRPSDRTRKWSDDVPVLYIPNLSDNLSSTIRPSRANETGSLA